ncbi:MAG: hypothetical protein KGK09_14885, partial [Burkholderiales bacterium]|nr:hypothetical protein [Burkholderiales bacterium]
HSCQAAQVRLVHRLVARGPHPSTSAAAQRVGVAPAGYCSARARIRGAAGGAADFSECVVVLRDVLVVFFDALRVKIREDAVARAPGTGGGLART